MEATTATNTTTTDATAAAVPVSAPEGEEELDALRAELLRQKLVFESELRRQREHFEERLAAVSQELADREADCRNLQAVVTILGKKVDAVAEAQRLRPPTPRRAPTPTRGPTAADAASPSKHEDPMRRQLSARAAFGRRASPLISAGTRDQRAAAPAAVHQPVTLQRAPSVNSSNPHTHPTSTNTSGIHSESPGKPTRAAHPHAAATTTTTTLKTGGGAKGTRKRSVSAGSARKRTTSASRVKSVKATDKW